MSRQLARGVLDQMAGRPSFIASRYAQNPQTSDLASGGMFADLRDLANADAALEQARFNERKATLISAYGYYDEGPIDRKPFAFADGKAIIPIHGILINRFPYSWSFATGYNFIRSQLDAAMADAEVDGIIYDHNSYGGTVAGCQETCDLIYDASARSGGKRSIAVIDANCFSASYMLACSADSISITSSGETASIGVVQMHMDLSGMLEKDGVKVTFQYAGDHKVDGNPFQPLSDAAKKDRQGKIDASMSMFVGKVVRGRGLTDEAVRATQARCVSAEEALSLGLVDAIQNPDDAVTAFFTDSDADDDDPLVQTETRNDEMATAANTQAASAAAPVVTGPTAAEVEAGNQAARTAERQRIAGITGHAEAKDRGTLASHLALETNMSVDEAGAILKVAAKETPAAPAAAAVTTTTGAANDGGKQEANHFQNAMNNSKHPEVGAGGENGGGAAAGGTEMTPAQRILAAQGRATGVRKPAA